MVCIITNYLTDFHTSIRQRVSRILPKYVKDLLKQTISIAALCFKPAQKLLACYYLIFMQDKISKWPTFVKRELDVGIFDEMRIFSLEEVEKLEGDIVECGVWTGRSTAAIALQLKEMNSKKTLHAFDSFEGFPEPTIKDLLPDGSNQRLVRKGRFDNTSYDFVKNKLRRLGVDDRVILYKGWFENTLPMIRSNLFSWIYLDCDLYESYKTCLEFLYPRLVPGGYIIFSEYRHRIYAGATKAIDEFFKDKAEKPIFLEGGKKWFIKKQ